MTALTGLRVVELAHEHVSFAGKLLADMGADVVLVEPPGGCETRRFPPFAGDETDPDRSLHFWHYNTNKRSVVLEAIQKAELRALIERADVLLSGLTQGGRADLEFENPRLIDVSITSFGLTDPRSELPQTDLTLMAAGGPPWSCGYDDHALPPVRGLGYQAYHTGAHFAFMSVLTALLERDQSGLGQHIDVSIVAALNVTTEAATYAHLVNGSEVKRQTGRHAAVQPTGETQMRCADGAYANTGVPPRFPDEFERLLAWVRTLGLEDEFPEAVFLEMGAQWEGPFDLSKIGADDTITAIFASGRQALALIASRVDAQTFFTGCQRAGLAVGPVNRPEQAFEDEQLVARGFQVEVEHSELNAAVRYPGAPYQLPASPWSIRARAPTLGEHTAEILDSLARD